MSNELNEKEIPVYKKGWFWLVIFLILLFWGANWVLVPMFICNPTDGGTFGDRFGAVNSLFTGFTILGLIITIVLQQNEINSQKKNMMKEKEYSFFFNLMNLQNNVLENVVFGTASGRHALESIILVEKVSLYFSGATIYKNYTDFIKLNGASYLQYIKAIQITFSYVVFNRVLTTIEKNDLITIFRSQLSSTELELWAYELHLNISLEELKIKTIEFNLFDNLDVPQSHLDIFTGKRTGPMPNHW